MNVMLMIAGLTIKIKSNMILPKVNTRKAETVQPCSAKYVFSLFFCCDLGKKTFAFQW